MPSKSTHSFAATFVLFVAVVVGRLGSAYPNPFADRVTIPIELETVAAVDMVIVVLGGRIVARPRLAAEIHPGVHSIEILLRDQPAGVYLVRFKAVTTRGPVSASTTIVKGW